MENIKDITGYEGKYYISSLGGVFSHKSGKKLKPRITNRGYVRVALHKDKKQQDFSIHRLVAYAFIDNSKGFPCINHKNGNKLDNRVENLEWCTHQYNVQHRYSILGHTVTEKQRTNAKEMGLRKGKPVMQLTKEGILCRIYKSVSEAGRITGFKNSSICNYCNGKRKTAYGFIWKYLYS